MAYVAAMYVSVVLILADVLFTSIRSTLRGGGDVSTYVLLSLHEVVAVAEGVIIFAFFSYTVWFTAGLLGHLTFTLRTTLPAWVLRLVFIQMYTIYGKFISSEVRAWNDPVYGVLFCFDIATCVGLSVSLMFTVSCLSEKRMYPPYHLEWRSAQEGAGPRLVTRTSGNVVAASTARGSQSVARPLQPSLVDPEALFPQLNSTIGGGGGLTARSLQ